MTGYNMSTYFETPDDKEIACRDLNIVTRQSRYNDREYTVLRYNKENLGKTREEIETTGQYRSVIIENNKIRCFAPPKSLDSNIFNTLLSNNQCYAEEFIEGTMINVFHDDTLPSSPLLGQWEIATRSCVGGESRFYTSPDKPGKTFREMFLETMTYILGHDEIYSALDKLDMIVKSRSCQENDRYCYSFVLQHPENRIVTPFAEPAIYLVGVYAINDNSKTINKVVSNDGDVLIYPDDNIFCLVPKVYPNRIAEEEEYEQLKHSWASEDTNYTIPGVMLYDRESGLRSKIRNPVYENVRKLRGNQPKLQYRFLSLRQDKEYDVNEYLQYYPEDTEYFDEYRKQVYSFNTQLHQQYMSCKVRKEKDIKELPYQFRNHVYSLHGLYLDELRMKGEFVNRKVVEKYVNNLPAARLMYSINYPLSINKTQVKTT